MKWLLPPVLVALCLILMVGLFELAPLGPIFETSALSLIGILLVATGVFTVLSVAYKFKQIDTNINTFNQPEKLITDGLFKYSRNPIYLSFLILLIGAAFFINDLTSFIGPAIFFLAANFWYIPYEEKAAEEAFGQGYLDYKNKVRRWL